MFSSTKHPVNLMTSIHELRHTLSSTPCYAVKVYGLQGPTESAAPEDKSNARLHFLQGSYFHVKELKMFSFIKIKEFHKKDS